jgi:hypothetical protein
MGMKGLWRVVKAHQKQSAMRQAGTTDDQSSNTVGRIPQRIK